MTNLDKEFKKDCFDLLLTAPSGYGFWIYSIGWDEETAIKYEKKLAIPEENLEEFKKHSLWDKVKDKVVLIKQMDNRGDMTDGDKFTKESGINWVDEKGEPCEINIPEGVII